jgi:hypothetical protein
LGDKVTGDASRQYVRITGSSRTSIAICGAATWIDSNVRRVDRTLDSLVPLSAKERMSLDSSACRFIFFFGSFALRNPLVFRKHAYDAEYNPGSQTWRKDRKENVDSRCKDKHAQNSGSTFLFLCQLKKKNSLYLFSRRKKNLKEKKNLFFFASWFLVVGFFL